MATDDIIITLATSELIIGQLDVATCSYAQIIYRQTDGYVYRCVANYICMHVAIFHVCMHVCTDMYS